MHTASSGNMIERPRGRADAREVIGVAGVAAEVDGSSHSQPSADGLTCSRRSAPMPAESDDSFTVARTQLAIFAEWVRSSPMPVR